MINISSHGALESTQECSACLDMQDRLTDSRAALVAERAGRVLSTRDICQSGVSPKK